MEQSALRCSTVLVLGTMVAILGCRRGAGRTAEAAETPTPGSPAATVPSPETGPATAPATAGSSPEAMPPVEPPVAQDDGHIFRETNVSGVPLGILRPNRGADWIGAPLGVNGGAVESLWEPEAADVERFLEALAVRFETGTDRRGPEVAARLRAQAAGTPSENVRERYRGQIEGFVVGGKKVIHGMFFCEGSSVVEDWLDQAVAIDDGGDCYFEGWFDVESGEIPHGFINGVA